MTAPGGDPGIQLIPVGTQNATRLGFVDNGLTKILVNDNDTAVWVDSQSGVTVNNGMVIKGRTSLNWTRPGQIWAIRETGAETGNGVVSVCSAADQWQPSPVDVGIAVATQLFLTGLPFLERTLALAGAGTEDISSYASVLGKIIPNTNPAGTNLGTGVAMIEFTIAFTSSLAVGDMKTHKIRMMTTDPIPIRLPIFGDHVSITALCFDAAGTLMITPANAFPGFSVYASSRTVQQPRIGPGTVVDSLANPVNGGNSSADGTLLFQSATIAANQNLRWFLPVYQGRVGVTFGAGAAAMNLFLRWGVPLGSTGHVLGPLGHAAGAEDRVVEVIMPSTQCQVEMNFAASAATGHVVIHALDL